MDVLIDPPSSDWILRGTRVFAVDCYLVDGEGKGQRLLGRHDFSTSGSVKRNLTASAALSDCICRYEATRARSGSRRTVAPGRD